MAGTYRMSSSLSQQYGQFVSPTPAEAVWHASCFRLLRPFGNIAAAEKTAKAGHAGIASGP
ncbi:hypothetical protein BC360_04300 [Ensifer sp. LC163]|nr:hypothetical protein BC361_11120 [Ensifer sp. LC54]OCP36599.1 hypothetical protein BC360_04300 [Ensifer sp. LC163]